MKAFFDTLRAKFGPLSQPQVDGLTVIFEATKHLPLRHQAYVLATVWHEVGATMQPIYEKGGKTYFNKYDIKHNPDKAKELGNTLAGDGYKFRGRGYVQLTGRANYQKASQLVGQDLVASPDLALKPDIASRILVDGMTKGWFTGKKMADFIAYKDMRRVVNGTDKADLIAGYAATFERALIAAYAIKPRTPPQPAPLPPPPDVPPPETLPPKAAPKPGARLAKAILVVIAAAMAAFAAWMTGFIGN